MRYGFFSETSDHRVRVTTTGKMGLEIEAALAESAVTFVIASEAKQSMQR